MIYTPQDLVYDLTVEKGKGRLTLTAIATRRKLTHEQAAGLDFLPDCLYPLTAQGSRVATWGVTGLPMKATREMFDAGIRNIADIDRIDVIEDARAKDRQKAEAAKKMAEVAESLIAAAEAAGVFRGPTPAPVAAENLQRLRMAAAMRKAMTS